MWYGAALLLKGYHSEEASGVPLIRGRKYLEKNEFLKKNNPPPHYLAQLLKPRVFTLNSLDLYRRMHFN